MKPPDKSPRKISAMFDEIAPTYDLLNRILSLNLDKKWRRELVGDLSESSIKTNSVLDLATGTGDLARELLKLNPEMLIAADFSAEMLEYQRKHKPDSRIQLVNADAQSLPFDNEMFDLITIAFGVRNFYDIRKCISEISRTLKPGGVLAVLEIFNTNSKLKTKIASMLGKAVPLLGGAISGSRSAYNYLYGSVISFCTAEEFVSLCMKSAFEKISVRNNFGGIVHTVILRKLL